MSRGGAMSLISSPRRAILTVVAAAGLLGSSPLLSTAVAAIPSSPKTVTPTRIPSRDVVGQRIFTNATRGFALATAGGADYPAATTDRGKTWKTAGPALHL